MTRRAPWGLVVDPFEGGLKSNAAGGKMTCRLNKILDKLPTTYLADVSCLLVPCLPMMKPLE